MAGAQAADDYEDVFEDGPPKEAQTIHRIRANSTIMHLQKISVSWKPRPELAWASWLRLTRASCWLPVANRGEIRESSPLNRPAHISLVPALADCVAQLSAYVVGPRDTE